jgi:hypothetical protein
VIYDSESKDSFSIRLPIHRLHHRQKPLLREYPFLHELTCQSFLLDHLGHEKFFGGADLFAVTPTKGEGGIVPGAEDYELKCV